MLNPCIPRAWPGFAMRYRHGKSSYRIAVENPHGVNRGVRSLRVDGQELPVADGVALFSLDNGGTEHTVVLVLG